MKAKHYIEIDASKELPPDLGLKYPTYSWSNGMLYGVYAYKRHEIKKYLKDYPHHKVVWLKEVPSKRITEERILEECSACGNREATVERNMFDGMCADCTDKALYNSKIADKADIVAPWRGFPRNAQCGSARR